MLADNQKQGKAMSGGRRIDNHQVWCGPKGKDAVAPDGVKVKVVPDVEGAGSLMHYEDNEEAIRSSQLMAKKQLNSHIRKVDHRY
jgi:hypothetical protein